MKKIIVVVLIALLVFGVVLDVKVNRQISEGVPLTEEYLRCTHCTQTVSWIIFSLISGLTLLFDPKPLATWLGKIWTKRNNRFALRLMGFFLLALIPLSAYSLTNDCRTICGWFSK
jgi:hypothetical protein